jgi:hypothetical protein
VTFSKCPVQLFALLATASSLILAQAPVGIISGTVADSSGALIPNAAVTIQDKANGTTRSVSANTEGLYAAPALPAGEYEVRVEMQGFRTTVRDAQVLAGSTTNVDIVLQVGETRDVVTVEGASAQITYDTHAVAGSIERETIQDIPLNGRSSLQLAALEPGVTVSAGATSQFNAMFNVNILGSSGGATAGGGVGPAITMDGGTINDEVEGGTSMNFSQEVVQEFQLSAANFDASTGIAAAGAVNIVTRSGGNDYHGSAYFYFRDHNMAAYPGLKRSDFNPNPFFARRNPGVWVSGPILKEKLFAFVSYEHLQQTSVITSQYDLASLAPLNAIWPSPLKYNWLTARFDYHASSKHTAFLRYSHDGNANFGPYSGIGMPSAWVYNSNWSDQTIAGVTSVLSPRLVNEVRAQYHYWKNGGPNANASDCQSPCIGLGLPSVISIQGSSTFTYGAGNDPNGPQFHQSRSFQVNDTVNWQRGNHRIRIGMDWEMMRTAYKPWDVCDPACVSLYSPEQTRATGGAFPAGAFANLPTAIRTDADLLQLPINGQSASLYSGIGIGNGSFPNVYEPDKGGVNNRFHPWVADTWKVNASLTLNFGLGYSLETGIFSSFLSRPQYLAPILNGANGGVPSGLGATPPNYTDFSPQAGFAYALGKDKKTVIRGGAGMYWETNPVWEQFRQGASIGPVGDGRITLAVSAFTNIFPNKYYQTASGVQPLPIGAPLPLNALSNVTFGDLIEIMKQQVPQLQTRFFGNTPTSGPYTTSFIDVTKQGVEIYPAAFPFLHSYQTSLGVQRELSRDFVISADWAQRIGIHANLGEQDLNRFARISSGLQPVIPRCAVTPNFNVGDQCSTGGITFWVPQGRSVYNGLLVKVQKRYSNHYQFIVSYALQKYQTETASVNLDNYGAGFGPVLAKQNLNVAGVVGLPWGFRVSLNSSIITATPANATVNGIDLNGAGQTNFSISQVLKELSYNCLNYSCGKAELSAAIDDFNTNWAGKKAANGATIPKLTLPSNYDLGTPIFTQDLRLTKEFSYKERYKAQIFGEFFNVANIANLTYSTTQTLNSTAFGQPTGRVGQASTFGSGGPRAIQVGARISF